VPALAEALKDQSADIRRSAAQALREIGPAAADAVSALAEALKDQNADVGRSAADALREIGPTSADVVPVLAEALKDQNVDIRLSAADILGGIRSLSYSNSYWHDRFRSFNKRLVSTFSYQNYDN
jgi:HEAT repeat protein